MSTASTTSGEKSPFSGGAVLAIILVGFAAFIALLYFLGAGGPDGERSNNGDAHAAANGLNGYAGLARLLTSQGYDIRQSRSLDGLETSDLLILTPPSLTKPEDFAEILQKRAYIGPTLVILPKWTAYGPPRYLPADVAEQFKRGWVSLDAPRAMPWTTSLPPPFAFDHKVEQLENDESPVWEGFGLDGELPTRMILFAEGSALHEPLVVDAAGHVLAFSVPDDGGANYSADTHGAVFVVEPDLVNNYGLADPQRAAAALALVREAAYSGETAVTFDLTLNGFGGSVNLLTLAFRPPFLAATLCLLLALVIIGWRAFQRFGPPAANAAPLAFGKQRLVANGAGLIVRAGRLRLLALPYAALSARRLAQALGLARPDTAAIDAAQAARLPDEEPFSKRSARLRGADKPAEILRAAQALDELTRKLKR